MAADPIFADPHIVHETLAHRGVEVWWVDLDDLPAVSPAAYLALLDETEQHRAARFLRERDRRAFVAAHALTRALLAVVLAQPPHTLRFVHGPKGKPDLHPDHGAPRVRFNLSHTTSAVVCAVAHDHALGVDIENRHREAEYLAVAQTHFAAPEIARLRAAAPQERAATFFAIWTLKEAYVKAHGAGLTIPLADFTVESTPPGIAFSPAIEDRPENWQLQLFEPDARHLIALALAAPANPPRPVQLRRVELAQAAALAQRIAAG